MWDLFAIDAAVAIVVLFVPGTLLLRGFGFSRLNSLVSSPVLAVSLFPLLSFCYSKAGFSSSALSLLVPVFCVSLFVFLLGRGRSAECNEASLSLSDRKLIAFWLVVSILLSLYVFLKPLDGANSFAQEYDNYAHLDAIRGFLDSSVYCTSSLLGYPFGWYVLVALVANVGLNEVTVAVNAVNFVLVAFVFPMGMFCLIKSVFNSSKSIMLGGAVCVLAFTEFPWGLLTFGPLYPNLLAFSLLPIVMVSFIIALSQTKGRGAFSFLLLFVIGCVSLVLAHPNSVFSGIVILVPFLVSIVFCRIKSKINGRLSMPSAVLGAFALVLSVLLLWTALYLSPALSGVVSFNWPARLSLGDAIANAVVLCWTKYSIPQCFLSILVFIGCAVCLVRKKARWIVVSFALCLCLLVVSSSTDGQLKHFLTGFWYTDTFRLGAMLVIPAACLASVGASFILQFLKRLYMLAFNGSSRNVSALTICVSVLVLSALFFPNYQGTTTPFGHARDRVSTLYSQSEDAVLSGSEISFLEKAKRIIPEGSVVANIPFDGSFLSYGVTDFKVLYTALESPDYWKEDVDAEGKLIRSDLKDYASVPRIKAAVEDEGIQYVLLLDKDDLSWERMFPVAKDPMAWSGIAEISDETPGFETVLEDGDMRLYKLTDI